MANKKEFRPLYEIAVDIRLNWKNVSPHAKPYLDAMAKLNDIDDSYFYDDGRSVVMYFLANASGWRGDNAKRIKAELKEMLK